MKRTQQQSRSTAGKRPSSEKSDHHSKDGDTAVASGSRGHPSPATPAPHRIAPHAPQSPRASTSRAPPSPPAAQPGTCPILLNVGNNAPATATRVRYQHKRTWRNGLKMTAAQLETQCAQLFHLGALDALCPHCGAVFFQKERQNRERVRLACCQRGNVRLPPLGACPPEITRLLLDNTPRAREYRTNIRRLNRLFAMASFRTSRPEVRVMPQGQGHWSLIICGEVFRYTDGIPTDRDRQSPKLSTYYFLDADDAIQHRSDFLEEVSADILKELELMLRRVNKFVNGYRCVSEDLLGVDLSKTDNVVVGFVRNDDMNDRLREFHLPSSRSNVAAVFHGPDTPFPVDLKLFPNREGKHHELKTLNSLADPFVYPLLFPNGEIGYSTDYKYTSTPSKTISLREYYRYRLWTRKGFSIIHSSGKLFQQYVLDGWCKAEASDLWYIRQNQQKYRFMSEASSSREGVMGDQTGQRVILPSSFHGGIRFRQRQYLDSMAVFFRYGKPDLFITFTCNPHWVEIIQNLGQNEKWEHRPDLVCRVFQTKLNEFINEIVHGQIFGVVQCYVFVIEFQKRSLPHAHIIITLAESDKLATADDVDRVIKASLPDPESEPLMYARVKEHMIHSRCGREHPNAPCMEDGRCSKLYPKRFRDATVIDVGGNRRPEYRRPNDGRVAEKDGLQYTNEHVVPYNPYTLAKYNCHTNFEFVGNFNSKPIRYLHKYIHKGTQRHDAPGEHASGDEIQEYLNGRVVSATEATWRLLEYKTSARSHSVVVLPVHLEGEDKDGLDDEERMDHVPKRSKLEAWFALNLADANARQYTYPEIPEHYRWDSKQRRWCKYAKSVKSIGCVTEIHMSSTQTEKYYLRLLLLHTAGATSYQSLLTVDDIVCGDFHSACQRRFLTRERDEYDLCMTEAAIASHPDACRRLFALLCCVGFKEHFTDFVALWKKNVNHFISDFLDENLERSTAIHRAVNTIETILRRNNNIHLGTILIGVSNLYPPGSKFDDTEQTITNKYDAADLNREQAKIFATVVSAVLLNTNHDLATIRRLLTDIGGHVSEWVDIGGQDPSVFYIDGPGGTGKTYLLNTIKYHLDTWGIGTVAVASTELSASLLLGGMTVGRAFDLPITLRGKSTCGRGTCKGIKDSGLIIWDAASMSHRFAVECVDRHLRKLCGFPSIIFGGKCVVFGGDFRQMLPRMTKGRLTLLFSLINSARIWGKVRTLRLSINERMRQDDRAQRFNGKDFSEWVLDVGNATVPYALNVAEPNDLIQIPNSLICLSLDLLILFVFGNDLELPCAGEGAVLCASDSAVREVNEYMLRLMGDIDCRTYYSVDEYRQTSKDDCRVTVDMLHAIESSALPPHKLTLKLGCFVTLVTNVDPSVGLFKGCRLKIIGLGKLLLHCELISGTHKGDRVLLPRLKIVDSNTILPSTLSRYQFPVRLGFATTIDRAQGQTMGKVGVYLKTPCFAHGQLYMAMSRVKSSNDLRFFIANTVHQGTFNFKGEAWFTKNVVNQDVLMRNNAEARQPR